MKREPVRLDWTDGNDIRLLQNGADFFPSLCAAIDAATVSVHLETYIFMLDRSGEMVLRCLAEAALRGVKVRVVLDGFGSAATADEVRVRLTNAGAQCRIFRPEPRWFAKLIRRAAPAAPASQGQRDRRADRLCGRHQHRRRLR